MQTYIYGEIAVIAMRIKIIKNAMVLEGYGCSMLKRFKKKN